MNCKITDLDPVAAILEYVFQSARNTICEETGYDLINDCSVGTTFYVHSNYMCSSFDWSQEAYNELQSVIESANKEAKEHLKENRNTRYFITEI